MKGATIFALGLLFALAAAVHGGAPPRFPVSGQYTWELRYKDQDPNTYFGGRAWNDYDAGYVRWDTFMSDEAGNKILTEITIFDYRNSRITYITSDGKCRWQTADESLLPDPMNFDGWTFAGFSFYRENFCEIWKDNYGATLYADAFTREVLSVTNTSVLDNSELIFSWDWSKPPANIFMVPMQLPCEHADGLLTKELIDAKDPFVRPMGLSCSACKLAVGKLIGMGCNAARAACALTGPIAPFCGVILPVICKAGCTVAGCSEKACRLIHAC